MSFSKFIRLSSLTLTLALGGLAVGCGGVEDDASAEQTEATEDALIRMSRPRIGGGMVAIEPGDSCPRQTSCCCKDLGGNDCRDVGTGCGGGYPIPITMP